MNSHTSNYHAILVNKRTFSERNNKDIKEGVQSNLIDNERKKYRFIS